MSISTDIEKVLEAVKNLPTDGLLVVICDYCLGHGEVENDDGDKARCIHCRSPYADLQCSAVAELAAEYLRTRAALAKAEEGLEYYFHEGRCASCGHYDEQHALMEDGQCRKCDCAEYDDRAREVLAEVRSTPKQGEG